MKTIVIAVLAGIAFLAGTLADAQAPIRVRGTITGVSGDVIAVKTGDGRNVDIHLGEKTNIVFAQPIAVGEIKPGDFLAVTSLKRQDGTLAAYDVRRFPKPVNPGHRPFDGGDDQTMTNAALSTMVDTTKGRELTLSYEGGSQKVVVADTAAISTLVPGQRSQLVAGSYVNLTYAPEADGKLAARNIEVRKTAPKLPQ